MRSVQLLEIVVGGMAVVFLAVAWLRGRRFERLEARVDQLEQGDTPGSDRISRLEADAEELIEELDRLRPQRKSRRRRWRLIQGGAVAVPIALIVSLAYSAAVAVLDRDVQGSRIMPASLPEQRALPAEEAVPIMPGEARPLPAMEPPEAPTMERSTEAEIVSAPPPGGDPGEQGHGGGGLSVVPPDASPPSSPGESPVAVEPPEPTPLSGTPRVVGETGPAPLVDLDVGVLSVTVEREDA